MNINVFLSTKINGITEEEKQDIYKFVKITVMNELCDCVYDTDNVIIYSNFDEDPAPVDTKHKKIHHLEQAFNKMKNCDVFFLLKENDNEIKPGCMVEMNAWLTACNDLIFVRNKVQMKACLYTSKK